MLNIHTISIITNLHCNLNCAGCNHFSPLADAHFTSRENFDRLVERLSFLCGQHVNIGLVRLLGGETLLCPDIGYFIEKTRNCFDKSIIEVRTNGILLNKMNKDFYHLCKKNNVKITVSDYNIVSKNKYPDYRMLCREKFRYNYFSDVPSRNDSRCSLLSECDGECLSRMEYAQLNENGDLFFCCIPANIYNNYYKKNIPVRENDDYVNIYKISNYDFYRLVVKRFMVHQYVRTSFCDYCRTPCLGSWRRWDGYSNDWIIQ